MALLKDKQSLCFIFIQVGSILKLRKLPWQKKDSRYINKPPSPKELEEALSKACQLWVISTNEQLLNDEHAEVIKKFLYSGKGVYIWGDNSPFHADANFLAQKLVGVTMSGVYQGG